MKKLSLLIPLALALAGCGDSSTTIGPLPPVPASPQATMPDAFYTRVAAVVSTNADDSEAPPIDAIVATTPEDSEPSAP
jgi:uncharacterized lipoprotein YajG